MFALFKKSNLHFLAIFFACWLVENLKIMNKDGYLFTIPNNSIIICPKSKRILIIKK